MRDLPASGSPAVLFSFFEEQEALVSGMWRQVWQISLLCSFIFCLNLIHILKKQEEETLAPLRNVVADGSRTIFSLSLSPNKGNTHKYTLLDVNQEDEY